MRFFILTGLLALFAPQVSAQETKTAVFAGGCFWCIEKDFEELGGVTSVVSGYTGGQVENPTYKQVSGGQTGHYEVVQVTYDPEKVSYSTLVDFFYRHIDPFDGEGQFCDRGQQYAPAIFYNDENEQQMIAGVTEALFADSQNRFAVKILPAAQFYEAEDYHQDYYKKNPVRYKFYRWNCGRDSRVEEIWGKS